MASGDQSIKLHAIGDLDLAIVVPNTFRRSYEAPDLQVAVGRDEKGIQAKISKPESNMYALRLPEDLLHGPIDVHVWTTVRPRNNQTFQIDAGRRTVASRTKQELSLRRIAAQVGVYDIQPWKLLSQAALKLAVPDAKKMLLDGRDKVTSLRQNLRERITSITQQRLTCLSHHMQSYVQRSTDMGTALSRHLSDATIATRRLEKSRNAFHEGRKAAMFRHEAVVAPMFTRKWNGAKNAFRTIESLTASRLFRLHVSLMDHHQHVTNALDRRLTNVVSRARDRAVSLRKMASSKHQSTFKHGGNRGNSYRSKKKAC